MKKVKIYRWCEQHTLEWTLPGTAPMRVTEETWTRTPDKCGRLHREDGPAEIITRSWNAGFEETWYRDGVIHRGDDKPARTSKQCIPGGSLITMEWYSAGQRHREPSWGEVGAVLVIELPRDGSAKVLRQEWWTRNQRQSVIFPVKLKELNKTNNNNN